MIGPEKHLPPSRVMLILGSALVEWALILFVGTLAWTAFWAGVLS